MPPFITPIQAAPANLLQHNHHDMQTVEERNRFNYEAFQTDAAYTVLSALGSVVSELAQKVLSMVKLSAKSEWRGRYGILRDYSQLRDVPSSCQSLRKVIDRFAAQMDQMLTLFNRYSPIIANASDVDVADQILSRIDQCDQEFHAEYEAIRREIVAAFRPYKCSDPQMLYPVMNALFMAERFGAVARYFRRHCHECTAGGVLYPLTQLAVVPPLIQLIHRLGLTDKNGHPIILLFDADERRDYERQAQKRSYQIKTAQCPPVVIDVEQLFHSDRLMRPAWKLETHMLELRTIDRIILASGDLDPRYRDDYRFQRLQSCANTYEQASLCRVLTGFIWSELPMRLRQFIDSVNSRPSIDPRRRPQPVVGYQLVIKYDKKGQLIRQPNGQPDFNCELMGVWHSSYEAERETDVSWQKIRKSVRCRAVNDGHNHVWLSLPDFIRMTHKSLLSTHPDIAAQLCAAVPEFF